MTLVSLLITIAIFALVCYVIFWLIGYLGVPEPIRKVVVVVIVLIAIIWILQTFLPSAGLPHHLW